ncbi:sensor histidine kinase KdpD [Streptacidiphilus sp. P02-A3a]|uniref:sensor histidine kinase n=1 Tax=Streptacidiphilus sp. P02-A3a TaxID=2704468 RepID=UPI001CDC2667|nr:sensor histidine kinase KdpD [Streptacidiphilus sp. P02-A3a]
MSHQYDNPAYYVRAGSGRGRLKVLLGAAPGVGKTYRMLDEARRRRERGADVVVAYVECHSRRHTENLLEGLEVLPRLHRSYRGSEFTEMDTEAVIARRPQVALVDELAHTNVPGGRHDKRWQDVQDLLDAGIDVLTTVNVQHLESLNDVVQTITGVPQRETVPDEVVRRANQIELVDMAPEGLRRRMAHGNVYTAETVDAALSNYFRVGNLTALRELALLWLAGRVDEGLQTYRAEHGISRVWETRERVVVALTGGPEGETLIRRAARIADRSAGGELLAVHVARSDGLADASPAALAAQRHLVETLGGSAHSVVGDDIPRALLDFARAENATQLVLGTSRRGRLLRSLTGRGIGETTVELSGDIDVHMVTHERSGGGRRLPVPGRIRSRRWRFAGPVAGLFAPVFLTGLLTQLRASVNTTSDILLFLLAVVGTACLGGVVSALVASLTASLLLNYYFIPPVHRFTISDPNNVLALCVFAVVAIIVASIVDRATRLASRAARATAEAETLSAVAGSVLRGDQAVPALLARLRETFGMVSVTLRRNGEVVAVAEQLPEPPAAASPAPVPAAVPVPVPVPGSGSGSDDIVAPATDNAADVPGDAVEEIQVGLDSVLLLRGRSLPAADRRVLSAFAAHVAVALERTRLAEAAAEIEPVKAADRLRTALLAAVSHDLRTPLSVALASVSSLRSEDVEFSAEDQRELLATAEEALEKLTRLVENLLDMSRLQAGALTLDLQPTALDEVYSTALDSLSGIGVEPVSARGLDAAPPVLADPPLLERVLANLIANGIRHTPAGTPVLLTASAHGDRVELRVIDRGEGLPPEDRDRIFQPFQRLGDTDNGTGVGLGLALSRGLAEAMGGTLDPEDTPGGGLTMVLSLPAAPLEPAPQAQPPITGEHVLSGSPRAGQGLAHDHATAPEGTVR